MSRRQVNGYSGEPPEAPVYDDAHRAFLQAFFSHSVFTLDKLRPVVAAILSAQDPERPRLEGDITEPTITSLIQNTNAAISPFDFEIRSARDQTKGDRTYALVNTSSDTFTQLATSFTPDEIAYIKRLLDAMFDENNTRTREIMAVKQMRATQLAKAPARNRQSQAATQLEDEEAAQVEANVKSIGHAECQRVLHSLVAQGFFQLSSKYYYSLAPRGLLELRNYLKETYNEMPDDDEDEETEPIVRIRDCEGCQEIVTIGLRCDDRDCGVRWHSRCANQFFAGQGGGARRCPKCKTGWTGTTYVGEKADRVQPRSSTAGGSSRAQQDEEVEEEE
ncbi:Non-structural maintenance of chromosomes element 1-like protein [Paraphaeosphaeria sporulosa]